ncbi:MAG: flagellar filament capping protein FliD [candidate division Zixibacteria bacterium]|nr:flagellar filament capping protein FliD [candidate division Zixibacteria bacterium]
MPLNTIDGLASNLNTSEIIDAMIAAARRPAVLMESDKERKTIEISNFAALTARLIALQTSMNTLNNKKSFSEATVTVSNRDILSATAESAIGVGSYSLNVDSLAQNHQIASQGFDDPTQTDFGTGTISLSLGDDSPTIINIESGQNSLMGIKDAINNAKTGVTASIINDGTDSKSYRLLLTGNKTGADNTIVYTSNLSGGNIPDFVNSSFDDPEIKSFSSEATSAITLGATSAFTGSTNKVYTFTVAGSGTQTVGSGNITIDWTDGTDSGSIVVSQADTEIIGPDGLKLSFADGDLVAGDTFKVSSFAPLLQEAQDAQVSIGSSSGGASPIVISSANNTFEDVIPGMTLDVKAVTTSETGPVTISTGLNSDGVIKKLETFINAYNEVQGYIDDQNKYHEDTKAAGVLMGDLTLQTIQSRLSGLVSTPIAGLDKTLNALSALGIRIDPDGKLKLSSPSKVTEAMQDDYEAVMNLFVDSGTSSATGISFLSGADNITGGDTFEVDITQAATQGYYQGSLMNNPASEAVILTSTNSNLQLRIDGRVSDVIALTERTYNSTDDLINELQTRINNDDKIGNMGVTVEWVDVGNDQGYIRMNSASYGDSSKVELFTTVANSAFADLNLADGSLHIGKDVEGTINGEAATGQGQVLTADEDTASDGLKLKITLVEADIVSGDEGTISITKGFASVLRDKLDNITKSGEGIIDRKTSILELQIEDIDEQIKILDERLAIRREALLLQFIQMEQALSNFNSQSDFLTIQLDALSQNTKKMTG